MYRKCSLPALLPLFTSKVTTFSRCVSDIFAHFHFQCNAPHLVIWGKYRKLVGSQRAAIVQYFILHLIIFHPWHDTVWTIQAGSVQTCKRCLMMLRMENYAWMLEKVPNSSLECHRHHTFKEDILKLYFISSKVSILVIIVKHRLYVWFCMKIFDTAGCECSCLSHRHCFAWVLAQPQLSWEVSSRILNLVLKYFAAASTCSVQGIT